MERLLRFSIMKPARKSGRLRLVASPEKPDAQILPEEAALSARQSAVEYAAVLV
jgi:hypothetical protein